jgi:pectinesterase
MKQYYSIILFLSLFFQQGYSNANLTDDTYKVVAQDGSGDYVTIQAAINDCKSFPYERITIFIKNGVYKEKVKVNEWNSNITLLGESQEKTIITNDDNFNKIGVGKNSTFLTYTLQVESDDVLLKNLTIENASGDIGQAIALSVLSDRVAVIDCKIKGNQDTLYASGKGRQYYYNCSIEGTTDFIFGNAIAYFENCTLLSKKNSYVTAASTAVDSKYGFVFQKCTFIADSNATKVFLGRPWRIHAKTVLLNCVLGNHIVPEGWSNWSKPEAESASFYAEYNSTGADISNRVGWSHQLNKSQAKKYTIKNCLGEDFLNRIQKL